MDQDTTYDDFDIDSGVDEIANDLFGASEEPDDDDIDIEIDEDAVEEPDEEDGEDEETEEAEETEEPEPSTDKAPPASWAKSTHEIWAKLPNEAKEQIMLREKQMLDGIEAYKEGAAFAGEVKPIIDSYAPMFEHFGVEPKQAVNNLLQWSYALNSGDINQRKQVYEALGRDLGIVSGEGQQEIPPEIARLYSRIDYLENNTRLAQQREQEAAFNKVLNEVEVFSKDPKNEHFDAVQDDLLKLVEAGFSLQDAYDRAVWMNPVTRAIEQERVLKSKQERKREEAKTARANAATNIKPSNKRGKPKSSDNMDEFMSELYDSIVDN